MSVERSTLNVERSAPHGAVFLSYAHEDAAPARRICEALRAAGVEVWFDQSELRGGDAWDAKIRKQIGACALFVPVISAATEARREGYFRLEWRLAAQRTHMMSEQAAFLVPVVIDTTRDAEADVPGEFRAVQWTRLPAGETSEAFCGRVQALLTGDSGGRTPFSARVRPAGETPALPAKRRYWPGVAAVGVALVAFALRQTWESAESISPRRDAAQRDRQSAEIALPLERAASPAVTALLKRARELVAKTDVVRSDLDTAASLLEQAAKQEPTNARVWAERSLVDWRYLAEYLDRSMARRASAHRHAAQAIGLEPENPLARLAQAAAMTAVQKDPATKQRMIHLLEPVVDRITDRADGLYLLASLQDIDRALELLDRAARMAGEAGRAETNRSRIFWVAGRMSEADEAADRALAAERSTRALLGKAYFLTVWHGDTAAAQRLLAEVPSEVWGEDFAASARYFMDLWAGNPDRALAAMSAVPREFIESYALSGPTGYYRGYALARANKPAAAAAEWRSALAVVQRELASRPNDQTLLTFSALLHWSLGDRTAALQVWQSLRELTGGRLISWENHFLQMTILPEEEAIAQLESLPPSDVLVLAANLRLNPYLDRFRNHPRFVALQAKRDADPRSSPRAAESAQPDAKSVAVLAFANLSDDKGNEYFSDGISEELLNVLAKVPGLKVTARTSAFHFKGKDTPIPEIAKQLGVAYVVEGSVRKQGDKVRITAQLIKAADGFHVWSDTFTRDLKDIFAVQDEIAGLIAKALSLKLGAGSGAAAAGINHEAYRLYLEGRNAWRLRTLEGYAQAEQLFEGALTLEPSFALAHAGLADVEITRAQDETAIGRFNQRGAPALKKVNAATRRALDINPGLAEAHATRGTMHWMEWKFDEATRALRLAITLNPNYANAHQWLGRVLMADGRLAEALVALKEAHELDPLSSRIADNYSMALIDAGRYNEALTMADRALVLQPDSVQAFAHKAAALAELGRSDEAIAIATAQQGLLIGNNDYRSAAFSYALARAGAREQAEQMLVAASVGGHLPFRAATLLALGKGEEALAGLDAGAVTAQSVEWLYFWPVFDPVRGDPRFVKVLATLGVTDAHARALAWRAVNLGKKPEARK